MLINDYDVPVSSWVHLLYIVILFDLHYMLDPKIPILIVDLHY